MIIILFSFQIKAQMKVGFDTDIMIGMPDNEAREVDDGITLIMALKQQQIDIVGISNITYVQYSYGVITKILNWHSKGAAIPVFKGSIFANDLETENDATRALYEALKNDALPIQSDKNFKIFLRFAIHLQLRSK
jgi:pyrimidine-specific ribonucleoside hydrolase